MYSVSQHSTTNDPKRNTEQLPHLAATSYLYCMSRTRILDSVSRGLKLVAYSSELVAYSSKILELVAKGC